MAVSWFTKTVVYSSTAVACCVAIMQYCRKKEKENRTDNQTDFGIIISFNTLSSDILDRRQIFSKNLVDPDQTPLKVEQVLNSPKQNTLNTSIKPVHSRKLSSMPSKIDNNQNSILNTRFLTDDDDTNKTFVRSNESNLSCESEYGSAQNGFYLVPIIHVGNSTRSTTQTNVLKSSKLGTLKGLKTSTVNHSADNRSTSLVVTSENDEIEEIGIVISHRC